MSRYNKCVRVNDPCSSLTDLVPMQVIAMAADVLDALGIQDKVVLELNSLGDYERSSFK